MSGHIDHGKTALVKALTGKDTDSLDQEKERGMTIDIGFAFLDNQITIIDVPGHEKFVKNMIMLSKQSLTSNSFALITLLSLHIFM